MRIIDTFEVVLSTFSVNKTRTILTMFAISIGMAAITFLVSLGYGMQRFTVDKISSSQALLSYSLVSGNSNIIKIDQSLVDKIKAIPEVDKVGLNYSFSGHLFYENSETDTMANIVDQNFLELESLKYVAGKEYVDDSAEQSLILSKLASDSLGFSSAEDAVGKSIKFLVYYDSDDYSKKSELTLKVAAVTDEKDTSIVYFPIAKVTPPENVSYSLVKAKIKKAEFADSARKNFEDLGLSVTSVAETIKKMNSFFSTAKVVLFGLGLVALLVASLGMFNTLTISLLERTREIGIMRVLGTTSSDIMRIFLLESVAMGVGGGIMGVVLGAGLGIIINVIVSNLAIKLGGEALNFFYTPPEFILMTMGASVVVGFVTGFYPAIRASRINPLDALRYE